MKAQGNKHGGQEDSFLEMRAAPRFALMMRIAKILCESGEYIGVIRDISASGTKLRLFHALPSDTHLFLELANGDRYAMERMWHRDDHAGFRFASSIDVGEFMEEISLHSRRPLRLNLQRPALVTADARDSRAMLVNLSQQGACIESGSQLAIGQQVRLEVDGLPRRLGHVCWRRDFTHGLRFLEAFRLDDLARHAFALQPCQTAVETDMGDTVQLAARCA